MKSAERIWTKFVELLNLQLHDGDVKLAEERPAKNLFGSIASHKKIYDQAVAAVTNPIESICPFGQESC